MLQNYIKKRIEFHFSKINLKLDASQSLFSSFDVDMGTKTLLNSLRKNPKINYNKILDLGCGYGVMGIFLKKQNPKSEVHCTDRDLLAIDLTKHNAELNNCEIKSYSSLDYENIKDKFNLIVCNYPAKAGINAMKKFIYSASEHLEKSGIFAVVIVRELENDLKKVLNENIIVEFSEEKSGYLIYHLSYKKEIKFNEDVYKKNETLYSVGGNKYKIKTFENIPEFDSISYLTRNTESMLKEIPIIKNVCIINPFQGHRVFLTEHYLKPKDIFIYSRDLLSLKITKENLLSNGFSNFKIIENLDFIEGDIVIWTEGKEENYEIIKKQIEFLLKKFESVLINSEKKIIERLKKELKLKVEKEKIIGKYISILIKNKK